MYYAPHGHFNYPQPPLAPILIVCFTEITKPKGLGTVSPQLLAADV
jgi:hypothetical protein